MIEGLNEAELAILKGFHGSQGHQVLLKISRARLVATVAQFLGSEWNEARIRELHAKARAQIEALTELRLDTVDLVDHAQDAVSQFESQLPTRVDYSERMRQEADATL